MRYRVRVGKIVRKVRIRYHYYLLSYLFLKPFYGSLQSSFRFEISPEERHLDFGLRILNVPRSSEGMISGLGRFVCLFDFFSKCPSLTVLDR